jgi:plastocyanin
MIVWSPGTAGDRSSSEIRRMVSVQHMEWRRRAGMILAAIITAPLAVSCGSSTPVSPTVSPAPAHVVPSTVMIMDTGPDPKDVTIAVGSTVSFMNHDTVAHAVAGGSDPARPDCPEIDAVGVLMPGDVRSTLPFTSARTCEYHDPRVGSSRFTGRIVIR